VNHSTRRLLRDAMKLLDLGLLVLSLGLTTMLIVSHRGTLSFAQFLGLRIKIGNFVLFALLLLAWHSVLLLCGLYQSRRMSTRRSEAVDTLKATGMASICLLLAGAMFSKNIVTPSFVGLFWLFSFDSIISVRLIIRFFLSRARRRGKNVRFMLILGTNARAIEFARRIESRPDLGYRILGFVDDEWSGSAAVREAGYRISCDFAGLAEFLRRNVVDEVATYLPLRSFYEHAAQVAALCDLHGILIRFDTDIFNLNFARTRTEDFDQGLHIAPYGSEYEALPMVLKRFLDVVISFALLILLVPVFLLVAVLVKLSSTGPIFFSQERIGLNKRRFLTYKFRTMIPNAEQMISQLEHLNEVSGPVFKIKNDPRLSPVGKLLRRTSIDELPQLFNVLKGDMSLVGPRPMAVRDYEGFSEDWQRRRFSVRPGITCLWQVNGRSSISFQQWMELDMQYIEQWSIWLDLKILARTIPAVMRGTGAA
jgi:exopolysaccharide biosynthesis polyprenyl glycosylphosphotransferase